MPPAEEYVERVLSIVEEIPTGRVMSYGAIADLIGSGGPRQVGAVMALYGGGVPWWRVVRADGTLPDSHGDRARQAYLEEETPLRGDLLARPRVDMRRALWSPQPR
ncbi:MGMT family protein [Solicola gregarius]|uniref:MGMT family protein n=1 Tax=Solicola gregarius TaxID=2908642 RepID=A0AA46TJS0_9ACTN|nr:MGMT family protein [Solicola gregarius]UYM06137.1 MGMT family protein [Solicola gregarius]